MGISQDYLKGFPCFKICDTLAYILNCFICIFFSSFHWVLQSGRGSWELCIYIFTSSLLLILFQTKWLLLLDVQSTNTYSSFSFHTVDRSPPKNRMSGSICVQAWSGSFNWKHSWHPVQGPTYTEQLSCFSCQMLRLGHVASHFPPLWR